ncbi:MAG: sirohydrochlorin cobaltochelatase [Desulfobulbaceae bacterium]|jgi:sirohydrochlorin cobaltochelatase|nr:sirohydrochlorin cobaltochelatase [Desulfobulbaceae bacterium]
MHQHGYIGRKMRLPILKEKPAIVIAAFGSNSRGKAALDIFRKRLAEKFPKHETFWAYTSEIIRKKMGLPSLQETLARVEALGFRKAVVQPLHIFPGTEYQQMAETCEYFPGLRVLLSETLLHRWDFVRETLDVVEQEFLAPDEGLNLLALHGTPLAADPVNIVYLGMERLVADLYPNVLAASVEGVPDHEAVLARMKRQNLARQYKKVKIIPMMYLAGMHAEDDLMGDEKSWRAGLEDMGFAVQCPMIRYGDADYFKGLAYYPELISFFMERLQRSLTLARYY